MDHLPNTALSLLAYIPPGVGVSSSRFSLVHIVAMIPVALIGGLLVFGLLKLIGLFLSEEETA